MTEVGLSTAEVDERGETLLLRSSLGGEETAVVAQPADNEAEPELVRRLVLVAKPWISTPGMNGLSGVALMSFNPSTVAPIRSSPAGRGTR